MQASNNTITISYCRIHLAQKNLKMMESLKNNQNIDPVSCISFYHQKQKRPQETLPNAAPY